MKVLVTGIAGALGRRVAIQLQSAGHEVIGIDRRPWYHPPEGIRVFQHDIRKRPAEDVFRTQRPEAMIHMATVTHLTHRSEDRFRINLVGTQAVFDHCHTYGVKRAIFVGRHTYYGAGPDSALYHTESERFVQVVAYADGWLVGPDHAPLPTWFLVRDGDGRTTRYDARTARQLKSNGEEAQPSLAG